MMRKYFFLLMVSVFSPGIQADDYTCPLSLEVKGNLSVPSTDWSGMYTKVSGEVAYTDGSDITETLKFVDLTLYAGEPKEMASLVPDNAESLSPEEADSVWTFDAADEQQKYPLQVACNYEGSAFGVFKKITTPVKSCTWRVKSDAVNNVLSCVPG